MIRLVRPPVPAELTAERQAELTRRYADNKASVWLLNFITETLLAASHNKCAYCEVTLEPYQGMQVDHLNPQSRRPDLVVEWTNLLPSCGKCNGAKSNHDVTREPVVNPFDHDPRDHLALNVGHLAGISAWGRTTIEVFGLNRLSKERASWLMELAGLIADLLETLKELPADAEVPTRVRRRLHLKAEAILRSALPEKQFAATSAYWLMFQPKWAKCMEIFRQRDWWTDEFEGLWRNVQDLALPEQGSED